MPEPTNPFSRGRDRAPYATLHAFVSFRQAELVRFFERRYGAKWPGKVTRLAGVTRASMRNQFELLRRPGKTFVVVEDHARMLGFRSELDDVCARSVGRWSTQYFVDTGRNPKFTTATFL